MRARVTGAVNLRRFKAQLVGWLAGWLRSCGAAARYFPLTLAPANLALYLRHRHRQGKREEKCAGCSHEGMFPHLILSEVYTETEMH